jgi:hypothetical protein
MNVKIMVFIVSVFLSIEAKGQADNINQLNGEGKKMGLWIENNGNTEAYYKNGIRDGLFKNYNRKNGKLSVLGEFNEGKKSGTWYYFDDESILILIESDIKENASYTRIRDDNVEITPKFVAYAKFYYPTGYLKEEGRVIYSEDIEIDYFKSGTWKYYNKKGELEETKEH